MLQDWAHSLSMVVSDIIKVSQFMLGMLGCLYQTQSVASIYRAHSSADTLHDTPHKWTRSACSYHPLASPSYLFSGRFSMSPSCRIIALRGSLNLTGMWNSCLNFHLWVIASSWLFGETFYRWRILNVPPPMRGCFSANPQHSQNYFFTTRCFSRPKHLNVMYDFYYNLLNSWSAPAALGPLVSNLAKNGYGRCKLILGNSRLQVKIFCKRYR